MSKNASVDIHKIKDQEIINDFQRIGEILETIKGWTNNETDTAWAGYENGSEFLIDLSEDIEKIKLCDYLILNKLKMEFAPTSTYQEISLSNGWSNEYLKLAEEFDILHERIVKSSCKSNKKKWWELW